MKKQKRPAKPPVKSLDRDQLAAATGAGGPISDFPIAQK
jgi:hypothetical protein